MEPRRHFPILKRHLDAAKRESARRKAAGEPDKFAQDVLDGWLDAGMPVEVPVKTSVRKHKQAKGKTHD